ncbi:MAG: hypothetical protein EOP83_18830 [Verrucomicrobiaceae bacterium]|nr:MAG: hypothetical protein EOP83_18830 [Verrucomicrobiaceae bacterium]
MHDVFIRLDLNALPVQYGVTTGSLIERFFYHAMDFAVQSASVETSPTTTNEFGQSALPKTKSGDEICLIEVEGEAGIIYRYHPAQNGHISNRPHESTEWVDSRAVDQQSTTDAVEILQQDTLDRAVVLRIQSQENGDVFFVATSSEMFLTTVLFSQVPC